MSTKGTTIQRSTSAGDDTKALTVRAFARRLGVGVHTVLGWIDRGELGAINVASTPTGKRWRILPEHIAAFEAARSARPVPAAALRRQKATKKPEGFVEYF